MKTSRCIDFIIDVFMVIYFFSQDSWIVAGIFIVLSALSFITLFFEDDIREGLAKIDELYKKEMEDREK